MFLCWLHCKPGSAHVPLHCYSILSERMTKVLSLFCKYSIIRPVWKIVFPWLPLPLLLVPCSLLMFCPCCFSNHPPPLPWSPLFQRSTPTAPLHSQQDSPPLLTEDAPSLMAFSNPQSHSWSTLGPLQLFLSHLLYQNSHMSVAYLILPLCSLNV